MSTRQDGVENRDKVYLKEAEKEYLFRDYRLVMEYSHEQLNYFRLCYVAFNLVPVGLRKIFKNEWDFRYKTTVLGEWKDTPQNGRDFYNNESKASFWRNLSTDTPTNFFSKILCFVA